MEEEEEDEFEVKFLEYDEYYANDEGPRGELVVRWEQGFEDTEKKYHKLFEKFHEEMADQKKICYRIIESFMKILSYSGANVCLIRKNRPASVMFLAQRKDPPCLPLVLKRYSETMEMENLVFYAKEVLAKNATDPNVPSPVNRIISMRLNEFQLFHRGYRQGVEKMLGNNRLLRAFANFKKLRHDVKHPGAVYYRQEVFSFASQAAMLALQTVLEDWESPIQGERIAQLTHANALQLRNIRAHSDSLTVLNESLICAIAFKRPDDQEELEELDVMMRKKRIDRAPKEKFANWKIISNMDRNKANAQGCLLMAQRLEEEAIAAGPTCAVLVETACEARAKCENQSERIIEVITDTIQRCPSLGPRMIQLAERCNVGYEVDNLCQILEDTNGLHPSEPMWLILVEKHINAFGKYRSVKRTLKKSLKVMFEFLDFDSNRFNETAWHLFKKVLEFTEPSFVAEEWDSRKDWWIKYQRSKARNGRKMGPEAEKVKEEVLRALDQYSSPNNC